ncbi:PREDICTED: uncharacterized protein LOC106806579 [Priapulus caudatus]|uniref:Uncharacterized protein LOC106806579 n=1 Tax=Priapulus caudatus TaxID=37621 RepID=A0ABM1DVT5_PRICU|nr:PREDICTED: uncharacterized protein LOC106806579 [Priapulus caudatus]
MRPTALLLGICCVFAVQTVAQYTTKRRRQQTVVVRKHRITAYHDDPHVQDTYHDDPHYDRDYDVDYAGAYDNNNGYGGYRYDDDHSEHDDVHEPHAHVDDHSTYDSHRRPGYSRYRYRRPNYRRSYGNRRPYCKGGYYNKRCIYPHRRGYSRYRGGYGGSGDRYTGHYSRY